MSLKPAVNRSLLLLLSGLFWAVAALILNRFAVGWLLHHNWSEILIVTVGGLVLGGLIARFGFSRVVARNIERIRELPQWACLFAFQAWHSYLLIGVMISMGILLRHTHFIPRLLLATGYMGIGLALLWGSLRYLREWRRSK